MTSNISASVLKDVVAYVDVWSTSKTENYSNPFIHQLRDLGAQVAKTLNKQVTHVVFKDGQQSTWNKAVKMGVKIVSVHWVARCKEHAEHADEELFPAINNESKLNQVKKRTHRCMQPRDIPLNTSKHWKRKLDKMMEGLVRSPPVVSDTSPFIIDEESRTVYSPSFKRADTMARRLREMRAQRENLSPTASQSQDSAPHDSPVPSPGEAPVNFFMQLEQEEQDQHHSDIDHRVTESDDESSSTLSSKAHVKKTHRNSVATFSSSEAVKKTVKATVLPQNKRQKRLSSAAKKQSSLDSLFQKRSLPKCEARPVVEFRNSLCSSKKSNSIEPKTSPMPQRFQETKANNDVTDSIKLTSMDFFSKSDQASQSNATKVSKDGQNVFNKRRQTVGGPNHFDHLSDSDDDDNDNSVFEDFFTSPDAAPRRKLTLVDSTSEPISLPLFTLEPMKKNRRKSAPHKTTAKTTKEQVSKNRDAASDIPAPTKVQNVSGPRPSIPKSAPKMSREPYATLFEETKQEPLAKKRRRRTKLSINDAESKASKSTSDGLADRSSEMCSKQESLKADKFMKKNRTLVMTSMPTEKQQTVLQVVNSLGGFTVVDTVCESTTHVVSGSPRRTLNVLLGIARGCWILSYEWILWCLEHRQWVPEEPYELSDHFPAAPICRLQQHLSAGEHQQDLFRNQPLMFVSPLSQPPCNSLGELIQLCGGAVSRSIRQAGICIGNYKGKKPEETKCVSEQWILDCVTHYILLPHGNYILE